MNQEVRDRIEKLVGKRPCWSWSDDRLDDWYWSVINRLAKNTQVMTGQDGDAFGVVPADDYDTHTALVLDIQPIKRGVTKREILKYLRREDSWMEDKEMADRIEREGISE
jgi:hypothetical protein